MKFSSSRTFPGQCQLTRARIVSDGILSICRPIFAAYFLVKCRARIGYVLGVIAQRRRRDREDFQPVIEIAAEEFVPHHLGEIPVGCRHQPDVDGDRLGAAQPLERLLLQSPQQLRLQIQRDIAHLIQKQSAPVGHLKAADLLRQGAGEGASLVAEQLAFEKPGRNGGTVQRDERKILARAHPVDGARHQFLPGAGFPQDQHGRIGRRNHFNLPLNPPQSRAAAYNLLEVLFGLDVFVLNTLQPVPFPQVLHKRDPSERRELQHRRGNQNRDAGPILANQLLFKRRAGSEPQTFFMRQFIQWRVFRRSEIGPVQPACQQDPRGCIRPVRETHRSPREYGRTRRKRCRRWSIARGSAGCARGCAATSRPARDDR